MLNEVAQQWQQLHPRFVVTNGSNITSRERQSGESSTNIEYLLAKQRRLTQDAMLKQEEISILILKTSWLAFSKNVALSSNGDAEKFFPEFYGCISDTENPFGEGLKIHASLLLGFEIANHLLGYLSGGSMEKDSVVQFKYSSEDISDKEKSTIHHHNLWSNE